MSDNQSVTMSAAQVASLLSALQAITAQLVILNETLSASKTIQVKVQP